MQQPPLDEIPLGASHAGGELLHFDHGLVWGGLSQDHELKFFRFAVLEVHEGGGVFHCSCWPFGAIDELAVHEDDAIVDVDTHAREGGHADKLLPVVSVGGQFQLLVCVDEP